MATNKSQVKCYKPSNLCVWVSMSLSHSKTDQNSRKIRSQICTSGQIYVSPASSGTTATNQDSHIRVLLASCRRLHYRNQLHMFVASVFSSSFFFWLHDGLVCSTDSFTCCKGRMSPEVRPAAMLVQSEVRHAG
jgi:hypothetical protein